MRLIVFIVIFLTGFTGAAQEKEVNLADFSQVEILSGLTVEFVEGRENKALIKGKSRDMVKMKVEDGKLSIESALTKVLNTDNTVVQVNYRQIESVEAREGSNIEFLKPVRQPRIILKARSGANIVAKLRVRDVMANALTGGKLDLSGTANYQEIVVMSEGDFRGENLKGDLVKININGGGNANIFSNNSVTASVKGGGHIYIYGKPKQVEEKTSYGGSIKKIN